MNNSKLPSVLLWLAPALVGYASGAADASVNRYRAPRVQETKGHEPETEKAMQVHYLEIVTPDVDATCEALGKVHDVSFGEPVAALGSARTASLKSGGRIGVRAPMRSDEEPVVRPYLLVDDLEAAVEAAREAGGEIALPPTEIPDQGRFAIYLQGGIQYGLWQY